MPQNKNHHFVPQFYLHRFGRGDSIALYNLKSRKHVPTASIAGQCQRDYLYGKDPALEKALSVMERTAAKIVNDMVASQQPPLALTEDEVNLIAFLTFQYGRTPAAAAEVNAQLQKMVRAIASSPMAPPEIRASKDEIRVEYADPIAFAMSTIARCAPMLTDLTKCVLVNNTNIEFIASDAPVVLHNTWCEGVTGLGTTGFACSGLQVLLPLDPKHAFLMFDGGIYSIGCKKSPKRVELLNDDDVNAINAMQLTVADHNLYYSGSSQMKAMIDALPLSWWSPPAGKVALDRALDDTQTSQLLHVYRQTRGTLSLSFLRLVKKAARIPLRERGGKHRSASLMLDAELNGPRESRYGATSRHSGVRSWQLVRDE